MTDKLTAVEALDEILREHMNCPVCQADWFEGQPHEHESDCIVGRYEAARREAVCPTCDGTRCVATHTKDHEGNTVEVACPDCNAPPRPADDVPHDLWVSAINAYDTNRQTGHCDAIKAVVAHVLASTKAEQAHG